MPEPAPEGSAATPLRAKPPLKDRELPLLRWTTNRHPLSDGLSLQPPRDNSADAAVISFVVQALSQSPRNSLSLAVTSATSIIPCAQHAHFLELDLASVDSATLKLAQTSGRQQMPAAAITCPLSLGLIGLVARSGVPVVEADASLHPSYSKHHEGPLLGRSPVLCVPVGIPQPPPSPEDRNDRPLGVLVLTGRFGTHFSALDLQFVGMMVDVALSRTDEMPRAVSDGLREREQEREGLLGQLTELRRLNEESERGREELKQQVERTQEVRGQCSADTHPPTPRR